MWKSLGHFFASFFQKVLAVAPVVEGVTAALPIYGPLGLTIEKAAFAVLGEVQAAISAGGAAAEAHLANAGLDANVIATVKAVGVSAVNLADVTKALPAQAAAATATLVSTVAAIPPTPPAA